MGMKLASLFFIVLVAAVSVAVTVAAADSDGGSSALDAAAFEGSTKHCVLEPTSDNPTRVDLTPIARPDDYLVPSSLAPSSFTYVFNICKAVSEPGTPAGTMVWESFKQGGGIVYGTTSSMQLSRPIANTQHVTAIMTAKGGPCEGGGSHNAVITFVCAPGGYIKPTITSEDVQTCSVAIEFSSPHACAVPATPSKGNKLGGGGVLLIIFFVTLIVYLLAGAALNHRNGKTGTDLVPNKAFWTGIPSLISDGFRFTLGKVSRSSYNRL